MWLQSHDMSHGVFMKDTRWIYKLHIDFRVGLFIASIDHEDFV